MIYEVRTTTSTGRKRKKDEIKDSYYQNFIIKCKCSHTMLMPYNVDKKICSHCGNYVYRNKKLEFKDKLLKKIKEKEYV